MIDFADILKSWGTAFSPSPEQAEKGKSRLEICKACEFMVEDPFARCSVCNCLLKAKVFSGKPCPKEKW